MIPGFRKNSLWKIDLFDLRWKTLYGAKDVAGAKSGGAFQERKGAPERGGLFLLIFQEYLSCVTCII